MDRAGKNPEVIEGSWRRVGVSMMPIATPLSLASRNRVAKRMEKWSPFRKLQCRVAKVRTPATSFPSSGSMAQRRAIIYNSTTPFNYFFAMSFKKQDEKVTLAALPGPKMSFIRA